MTNLIDNPSFEVASPDPWTYANGAARSNAVASDGSWSAKIPAPATLVPGALGGKASQSIAFAKAGRYTVALRLRTTRVPVGERTLTLTITQGGSPIFTRVISTADLTPNAWNDIAVPMLAPHAGAAQFSMEASVYVGFGELFFFYADEVSVEEGQMVTKAIRNAILADLATVAGGNVYDEQTEEEKILSPAIMLFREQISSSNEGLGICNGMSTHLFLVILAVRSATPKDDLADLFDAVRNAVEADSSNAAAVKTANYTVSDVVVTQSEQDFTSEDVRLDKHGWMPVEITVEYQYVRGSS